MSIIVDGKKYKNYFSEEMQIGWGPRTWNNTIKEVYVDGNLCYPYVAQIKGLSNARKFVWSFINGHSDVAVYGAGPKSRYKTIADIVDAFRDDMTKWISALDDNLLTAVNIEIGLGVTSGLGDRASISVGQFNVKIGDRPRIAPEAALGVETTKDYWLIDSVIFDSAHRYAYSFLDPVASRTWNTLYGGYIEADPVYPLLKPINGLTFDGRAYEYMCSNITDYVRLGG